MIKKPLLMFLAAAMLGGCGGMDETYKQFLGDGPIVYLAKYPDGSVQVLPGKRRLKFTFPTPVDPRVTQGTITWWGEDATGMGGTRTDSFSVAQGMPTELILDKYVPEGSYSFSVRLFDATKEYSSLAMTITGQTYGDEYEALLQDQNRVYSYCARDGVGTLKLYFLPADVPPLSATKVAWKFNNVWRDTTLRPYVQDGYLLSGDTLLIDNFKSDTIAYSVIMKPTDDFIDSFVVGPAYIVDKSWAN